MGRGAEGEGASMSEAAASCRLDGETVPVWPVISVVNVTTSNLRKLGLSPEQVCYVGRGSRWHKWPESPWMNPFRVVNGDIEGALSRFREYAAGCMRGGNLQDWLGDLWEEGDAEHGDGQPMRCHAQLLAVELHKRFVEGK